MSIVLVGVPRVESAMAESQNLYFDYQASTPIDPRVEAYVASISDVCWANPHADDHAAGWEARKIVDQARCRIAGAIGALSDEVIFTSGATEADNLGVLGAALGAPAPRKRLLVSAVEHKAVLESAYGAQTYGYRVELIPVTASGVVDLDWLAQAIGPDVAVVSVMAVNNEIGTVQPIAEVAELGSRVGAFVHTDATQAPLALAVDVLGWNVDAASFSSHKVYGPRGVGALFLAASAPWRPRPLMFGGGQEQGLRPGTLPTALCAGFGLAMSLVSQDDLRHASALRDRLWSRLKAAMPDVLLTATVGKCHPGSLHLRLPGTDVKDLLMQLQPRLSASTGSACTSGHQAESHVLRALGLSDAQSREGLRLSLGRFTTEEEVDLAADLIFKTRHCRV
jgi:cysteine desulfurase